MFGGILVTRVFSAYCLHPRHLDLYSEPVARQANLAKRSLGGFDRKCNYKIIF